MWDWSDSVVGKAFALHAPDPSLIPSTTCVSTSQPGLIHVCRASINYIALPGLVLKQEQWEKENQQHKVRDLSWLGFEGYSRPDCPPYKASTLSPDTNIFA